MTASGTPSSRLRSLLLLSAAIVLIAGTQATAHVLLYGRRVRLGIVERRPTGLFESDFFVFLFPIATAAAAIAVVLYFRQTFHRVGRQPNPAVTIGIGIVVALVTWFGSMFVAVNLYGT